MHAAGWMGFVGGGLPANARRGGRASATAAAETRWLVLRKKRKPDVWVHWGRSVTGAGAWTSGASAFVGARASLRGAGRVATRLSPRVASTPGTHWIVCGTGDAASRGPRSDPRDAQCPPSPSADASSAVVQNGQMEWSNAATPASGPWHPDRHLEGADTQLDAKYRAWRIRTFYSIFLGYAFFYFTRNSFTYTAPALRAALGLSLGQLGIIVSVFPLAYGFSKLLLGIAADRFSTRLFLSVGIMLTGLVNILFGLQSSPLVMTALWFLNGIFQGCGAPPCAKLLTKWYSKSERGTWWGVWNTSHNTGGFFIPLLVGYCVTRFGWRFGMLVPGVLGVLMGFFLLNRVRDSPEDVGLPPIEVYRDDYADPADKAPAKGTDAAAAAAAAPSNRPANKFIDVLRNPYVLLLAVSYFFIYFCRQGVSSWSVIYLTSMGVAPQEAAFRVSSMELGGLCGSLVSGAVSDRLARGRRIPVILVWMLGVIAALGCIWAAPVSWRYASLVAIFMFGFFIYGPQMLVGLAASEMVHSDTVSSTIGLLGWVAYTGAAASGYPLTRVVTASGWNAYFVALIGCASVAVLLLLPMWQVGTHRAKVLAVERRAQLAASAAPATSAPADERDDSRYVDCVVCASVGTRFKLECGPATPAQTVSCKLVEVPCEACSGTGRVLIRLGDEHA